MPRTRAKSPPRLTRDAERLIALANGLNASGSLTEDRFWETEMSSLVAKLLENGNDAPIDGALDHLYQTNPGAYDTLIELVENESESVVTMQGDRAWQALLVAAPIVAWSKYAIPSGAIAARPRRDNLRVQLQAHVLADGARVTLRALPLFDRPAAAPFLGAAPAGRAPHRCGDHRRSAARRPLAPAGNRAPARRHALPRGLRRGAPRPGALPLAGGCLRARGPHRQPGAVDRPGAAHARARSCRAACSSACCPMPTT